MNEQTKDRLALIYAIYTLVSLLGCPCAYFASLFVVRDERWVGFIVGCSPFSILGLILLLSIKPASAGDTGHVRAHLKSVGLAASSLTIVSSLIVLISAQSHNSADPDHYAINLMTVITIICIWAAGFFAGLTIILLGNYWFRYRS